MKILLTGHNGQLGHQLLPALQQIAEVSAPPRSELDLSQPQQVRDYIRRLQPHLIINTAAYTAVDQAESEGALAMCINADAPAIMAEEAQRLSAAILHYSTDYVFDGKSSGAYDEAAATNPLNVYGSSKQRGEQELAAQCEAHWIVRCSWIYDVRGRNFLRTFWRLAQEREQLSVVDDQTGAPTWAHSIAAATTAMLQQALQSPLGLRGFMSKHAGIYHMSAQGQTSWHGMAAHILQRMQDSGIALRLSAGQLHAIPSSAYPTPAQRPLNSTLDSSKLAHTFQLRLPDWRSDLDLCIDALLHSLMH